MLNVCVPLSSFTKIWSGSSGSTETWTLTPWVPGPRRIYGRITSSEEYSATRVPVAGVPSQTRMDHWVTVCSVAWEVAKIISIRSILIGKAEAGSTYEAAAISCSARPASAMNEPP
jgi:hypothetical protein